MCRAQIVGQIDAGTIHPRTHTVVPALAESLPHLSNFHRDILERFYQRKTVGDLPELEVLWAEIEALPLERQGRGRLLVSLFHPDKPVDWEHAEYLILWAHAEGAASEAIRRAFSVD